jgi:ribulose-5-phosphate 4-epimerase/fuculose-1-phosphate aldolase
MTVTGSGAPAPEADESRLRHLVATAGAILYQQGLVDYLGHCSARVPGTDRVIIKPKFSTRTRALGSLKPDDLLVIDLDGVVLEGDQAPPAEWPIHTSLYRARPDIAAIVHTHQPAATLLGVMELPLVPVLHIPSVLTNSGDVGRWRCAQLVTTPDLGRSLAEALSQSPLCHLQGHGIVSVAGDIPTATLAAIAFEQLAEANLRIRQAGSTPRAISEEDLRALRAAAGPVEGRWAYYEQLLGNG